MAADSVTDAERLIVHNLKIKKKQNIEEDEGEFPKLHIDQLPNHILQHIFELLSSMDLATCWYVSKTWSCIVTNTHIAKCGIPKTFLILNDSKDGRYMVSLDFDTKYPAGFKIANRYKIPNSNIVLGNSCNCLLSLRVNNVYYSSTFYILNPMTGEYLRLPESPDTLGCIYGFGFSRKKQQYKMMRIIHVSNHPTVEICVVKAGPSHSMSWKSIGSIPYREISRHCVYFNGALYWIAYELDSSLVVICRFDVEDETIRHVYLPIIIKRTSTGYDSYYDIYPYFQIGTWGNDFYFIYTRRGEFDTSIFEICVMKEHGVNGDLWTKYLEIQARSSITRFLTWPSLGFIKISETGEILITCDGEFMVLYEPLTKYFRVMKFGKTKMICFMVQSVEILSYSSLRKLLMGNN